MKEAKFSSGVATCLYDFVTYRKASNIYSNVTRESLENFDRWCSEKCPNETQIMQKMVDGWLTQRKDENANTRAHRNTLIRKLVQYLDDKGTCKGIVIPRYAVRYCDSIFTPHFFTEKELASFFNACDQLDDKKLRNKNRALVVPVFFRLLHSSGMRTCEARLLTRKNIDLLTGIITVLHSKGPFDHYVVLDETMLRLMQVYDKEMNTLSPNREYFFPSRNGGHYKTSWESKTFRQLWKLSGGAEKARAYDLRHHYAIENINGWMSWNGSDYSANLKYLSKSMGHSSILATLHYYHLAPKFQQQMAQLSGDTFSNIVKELEDE